MTPFPLQENKCLQFIRENVLKNINTCAYENLRALQGFAHVLADRIWDLRKQGGVTLVDLTTISKLKITPELLDCLEINSLDHSDEEDAKQLSSDGIWVVVY